MGLIERLNAVKTDVAAGLDKVVNKATGWIGHMIKINRSGKGPVGSENGEANKATQPKTRVVSSRTLNQEAPKLSNEDNKNLEDDEASKNRGRKQEIFDMFNL